VFCFNDQIAMGVYQAAAALGIDIPGDCSVLGVDDLDLVAAALEPALTTIALPHREMGRWGMTRLLDLIDSAGHVDHGASGATDAPAPLYVRCELVERGSVAPPRS